MLAFWINCVRLKCWYVQILKHSDLKLFFELFYRQSNPGHQPPWYIWRPYSRQSDVYGHWPWDKLFAGFWRKWRSEFEAPKRASWTSRWRKSHVLDMNINIPGSEILRASGVGSTGKTVTFDSLQLVCRADELWACGPIINAQADGPVLNAVWMWFFCALKTSGVENICEMPTRMDLLWKVSG